MDKRRWLSEIEVDLITGKNPQSGLLMTADRSRLITILNKIKNKK